MNLVKYIDDSGWRTKMTALCWLLSLILLPIAYLAKLAAVEGALPLIGTTVGIFVLPLVLIPLWPLLKITWLYVLLPIFHYVLFPIFQFGSKLSDRLALDVPSYENEEWSRRMTFGEMLSGLAATLVAAFYYLGGFFGILTLVGLVSPSFFVGCCLVIAGLSTVIVLGMFADSQKAAVPESEKE